jgi:hypothetical protein
MAPLRRADHRHRSTRGCLRDNIINADSHVIVLNASDLGFVRNQFIRCRPSCSALNPIIYTYLENYLVNPFAASGNGGSGFPIRTGYPTQDEAAAAINSAVSRPLGEPSGLQSGQYRHPVRMQHPANCRRRFLNGRLQRMALRRRRGSGNCTPMSSSRIKTPG